MGSFQSRFKTAEGSVEPMVNHPKDMDANTDGVHTIANETPGIYENDWKTAVEQFKKSVLDDSYLPVPIRGTSVNAADLYPSSFPNQPGLMPGSHKHLGGAYDKTDGCIYGVPANSKSILCMYPSELGKDEVNSGDDNCGYKMTTIPLPERIVDREMKWLRGIVAHGYLWAIPAWADSVLCVDLDAFWGRRHLAEGQTDVVQLIPLPEDHPKSMRWQWHGAGINKEETAIYCIPSNAKNVLKVDIGRKTTSFIEIEYDQTKYPEFTLDGRNKWYGGIVGDDNAIYGIPYRACGVLRIDSKTDSAKIIGPNYGIGNYFWHGGIKVKEKIYAHPSHSEKVLVIDTTKDAEDDIISELTIHRAAYDTDDRKNYKWLGGCVGADGNIYCPACDTSSILKINVTTDHCETLGFTGKEKNKWQGGILGRDGCIYCIPANGLQVCRIATDENIEDGKNPVQLIGNLSIHKDKWQGAAKGKDGSLYFIPENSYRVMRVTPPENPPIILDGKLPEGDVKIELI
eukprot:CAMPEP_0168181036 /NCGR_PEP_ID=MMETSP0139_2-20121125/10948_1 /TAXON_ID=44445 /ORGANISM="Pseudo-nitzschia australis, Strain 10249 10 AB" /LENGTH=513 /DNA_ID=CAMNT_0008101477 /DNA_START=138 /DNA_END=1682 /DNA_ORIENTATION=+